MQLFFLIEQNAILLRESIWVIQFLGRLLDHWVADLAALPACVCKK